MAVHVHMWKRLCVSIKYRYRKSTASQCSRLLPAFCCLLISASTRFVKCDKCHHFFVVLSDIDTKKSLKADVQNPAPETEQKIEKPERKLPPPVKVSSCNSISTLCLKCELKINKHAFFNFTSRFSTFSIIM